MSVLSLKVLRAVPRPKDKKVVIVTISLPWLIPSEKWFVTSPAFLDGAFPNVAVHSYDHWRPPDDRQESQILSLHGSHLTECLLQICQSEAEWSRTRIVLMGHSLAGFVLKYCLVEIHTQIEKCKLLRDAVAGIVFLGTPHCTRSQRRQDLYDKCASILRLGSFGRRSVALLNTGEELISICNKFDEISESASTLLLHETKVTRSGGMRIPGRGHGNIIVDQRMARIDSNPRATLIAIDTDHRALPSLRDENNPPLLQNEHASEQIRRIIREAAAQIPATPNPAGVFDAATNLNIRSTSILPIRAPSCSSRTERTMRDPNPSPPSSASPSTSPTHSTAATEREPALEPLIEDFAVSRLLPTLPCIRIDIARQRNRDFHGREDVLRRLEETLLEDSRVAVVYGTGGVGKSDVALEFVHRHKEDYDAVFWIPADDVAKMRRIFGRIAVELKLEKEALATDPHNSREIAKAWLSDPKKESSLKSDSKARWLVVFDGAGRADTLKEFEPIFHKGSVLITTQDQEFGKALPCDQGAVTHIGLNFFNEDEAASFLIRLASKPGVGLDEDRAAKDIVKEYGYGGWPLAISQMARMIRNKYDVSLTEFRDLYTDSNNSRMLLIDDAGQATIASAMKIARLSPHAMATLRVCAMLDPDCIQESLFAIPGHIASTMEVALNDFPLRAYVFADARAELLRSSFMHRNPEKQELWMHRVVRDFVRRQCSDESFDQAFRTAAVLVAQAWKSPGADVRDNLKLWEPCASFLNHVLHLQYVYNDKLSCITSQVAIEASFPFAWLLCEAACFQTYLGNTAGQKTTLDLALKLCGSLPKAETFTLLSNIYHSLGAWANETNHAEECHDYNDRYLGMRKEAVEAGADPDEGYAYAWNQYGTALMMTDQIPNAMDAFQKSIDVYRTLPRGEPCLDSLPIVNLAGAKWLTKDFEGASTLLEAGLLAREDAFGFDDKWSFRTGRFFHTLGNVRYDQNRLEESKIWHKRALKQFIDTLGKSHHRTADVRHRVAQHCLRDREVVKAGKLIDQALSSWQLDAESFRPEIARTTWLKARQKGAAGEAYARKQLQWEAATLRNELRPDDRKAPGELEDRDFDDLVAFWSR